ncbi:MAG: TonB-dependent receptor [Erythrobacter sp.]|nr:MAG: TonB-dependent receptor [Erythrobacter sp.]
MKVSTITLLAGTALFSGQVSAQDGSLEDERRQIIVSGERLQSEGATKTTVPAIEVPQPVTVIPSDLYELQGAVSISDTLNYVAGVHSNPYGPDSRVDGGFVRGVNALQFRDGMRDIFSFYASIRADPYNFEQVEVLRGPSSGLFGAGSLGGIINLVSKTPQFTPEGEVSLRVGSFDRLEALADITGPVSDTLAARVVARVRDSGTQTDFVPDDRIMVSPSLTWAPSMDTELTLIGLYQEDDGGSTSQFLPLVGTILPNPNGQLPGDLFIGKPGWDRYDGRLLQGTALFTQRFGENVRLNLRGRYIDSDLTYFTHYPNSYSNPANPYVLSGTSTPDPDQRTIGLYADGSIAGLEVASSDNNVQIDFNTGANIEHVLLAGVDYSWSRVRKRGGFGFEYIDIYDIDYDALNDFGGGLPQPESAREDVTTEQLGFYVQDQIRFFDRVSLMLGARHDNVTVDSFGTRTIDTSATSFRAGLIGEVVRGVSPFVSYTESFEPIAGTASDGTAFSPLQGSQWEVGVKIHPFENALLTLTYYDIDQTGRPISDDSTADPTDRVQAGRSFSRGFEAEGSVLLPGNFNLLVNYSHNEAEIVGTGRQLDNVPKENASIWLSRPFTLSREISLLLGGGVRYAGDNVSYGAAFPDGLVTPGHTLVDAVAELRWNDWSLGVNATNLLGEDYYSACLARGDCFQGNERNVFATLTRRF